MRIINKSYKATITLLLCVFTAGIVFQSCNDEDEFRLDAFGPSKVERCGEICFMGKGLDKVEKVIFPVEDYTKCNELECEKLIIEKSQFISQSSEEIKLSIPCDYPLDTKGVIRLIHSGGREFVTNSSFMVLSDVSVTAMNPVNDRIEPGTKVTIFGKVLLAVDSLIFDNGMEGIAKADFIEHTDKQISFILPDVPTGTLLQLKVPGRWEDAKDSYVDVCQMSMPLPEAVGFSAADGGAVRACFDVVINMERLDRLDYNKDSKETTILIGKIELTGMVNEENNTIVVSLPNYISGGTNPVKFFSWGKLNETKMALNVQYTVPGVNGRFYEPDPIPAVNSPTFTIFVQSACTVDRVLFTDINDRPDRVATISDRTSESFTVRLANYKRGEDPLTLVLFDVTRIEIPAPAVEVE